MRVLVTGAAGFTGTYVVAALAAHGHAPCPLEADITDADAVSREVAAIAPEAAIHLAARAFVQSDDFASFYAVNQVGAFNVLNALAVAAVPGPVVLASSAQVYGAQAAGLIAEAAPLRPSNHYALSKAAMEMGADLWADRLRIVVARPFNYTGVGQEDRYLVPKIVGHFARRAPAIELGNLDVRRDFGDVRAVAEAYCGLLDAAPGEAVFNMSTGVLHSVRDILDILRRLTGHDIAVRVNPLFVRANDVPVLGGRNDRLRAALPQWAAPPLEDSLRWMLANAGA